ncbi:MAG: YceI family protein [Gammaproteobacteria bacterium]|nr:YceI family protein [Gammaproteobacteria bacterium]MCW5583662.1 YceI family protein [Gammaproteobacteria bacterium]
MIKFYVKTLVIFIFFFLPFVAKADVPAWEIVPNKSSLTFTGTQNNGPVSGSFKKFNGEITFDPAQLEMSNVIIKVDTSSVSAPYSDLVEVLKSADWFSVKHFPVAVFKASQFIKTGDNKYDAKGTLTIRDKTIPITVNFIVEEMTKTTARVKGSVMLKRNAFGIGQGEWASTEEIKDEVKVDFVLSVIKK